MISGDQFVGSVTIRLGLVIALSSFREAAFLFELAIPKFWQEKIGRWKARILLILIGLGVCFLGTLIMLDRLPRPFA